MALAAHRELRQVSTRLQTYSEWLLGKELLQRWRTPMRWAYPPGSHGIVYGCARLYRWSETHSPEEVVQLLNRYYSVMEATMTKYATSSSNSPPMRLWQSLMAAGAGGPGTAPARS
jgi:hypothetical protein